MTFSRTEVQYLPGIIIRNAKVLTAIPRGFHLFAPLQHVGMYMSLIINLYNIESVLL